MQCSIRRLIRGRCRLYNIEVSSEHSTRAARASALPGKVEVLRGLELSKDSLTVPWLPRCSAMSSRRSDGFSSELDLCFAPKSIYFLSCFTWLICSFPSVCLLNPAVVALLPSHFQDCMLGRRAIRYIQVGCETRKGSGFEKAAFQFVLSMESFLCGIPGMSLKLIQVLCCTMENAIEHKEGTLTDPHDCL